MTNRKLGSKGPEVFPIGLGCMSLGIADVYTSSLKGEEEAVADDWRRNNPRFQGENFARNLALADRIGEIAQEKAACRRSLRLRGCWHRATTSSRSRA